MLGPLTEVHNGFTRLTEFHGQRQAQVTWCWAATAASIDAYYARRRETPENARSQCSFVHQQLGHQACRRELRRGDCTRNGCSIDNGVEIGWLDIVLDEAGKDLLDRVQEGPISFREMRAEIDAGRPVAIRLDRSPLPPHLILVVGYNAGVPSLLIWNPARGESAVSYNGLSTELGRWSHTVFTMPMDFVLKNARSSVAGPAGAT